MTQIKVFFKDINKWAQRPGCIATATILNGLETTEMDIFSKQYAIDITIDLIATLKMWINIYEFVLSDTPSEVREYLWNSDKEGFIYNHDADELKIARNQHEKILLKYYPADDMKKTLTKMQEDLNKYEKLFTYFNSL